MNSIESNYIVPSHSGISNQLSLIYESKLERYNPEESYLIGVGDKNFLYSLSRKIDDKDSFKRLSQFSNMAVSIMQKDENFKREKYKYAYIRKGREENDHYISTVRKDRLWLSELVRSTPYYGKFIEKYRENSKLYLRDLTFKDGVLEGCVKKIGKKYYFTIRGLPGEWISNKRHDFEDCKPIPLSKGGIQPESTEITDDYDNETYLELQFKKLGLYFPTNFTGKSTIYGDKDDLPMSNDNLQRYMYNLVNDESIEETIETILRIRKDNPDRPWRLAYKEDVISPWAECCDDRYTLEFFVEEQHLTKVTTRLFGKVPDIESCENTVEHKIVDKRVREKQWREENKNKYNCDPCGIHTNNKSNYTRHLTTKKHAKMMKKIASS